MNEANREVLDRGSLMELLVQRARQASDLRLVVYAALGFAGAVAILVLLPPFLVPLAALAFALGSFGVWGILDREAFDTVSARGRAVATARTIVAVLGFVAAIVGGIFVFFGLLGTWIS